MKAKGKKRARRTYRRGVIYFCAHCHYYSWLGTDADKVKKGMHNPMPGSATVGRTCNDCKGRERG